MSPASGDPERLRKSTRGAIPDAVRVSPGAYRWREPAIGKNIVIEAIVIRLKDGTLMGRLWQRMWEVPTEYRLIIALFLKGLALIYLAAFVSLTGQIEGLAGSQGILPLVEQQSDLAGRYGLWSVLATPSLFWINSSDTALVIAAWAGSAAAVLLLFGILPRVMLVALYVLYLSLYHAGSIFMNFQWDTLLLETGFLAIFLAVGGARLVIWLMRWLLFRLRFLSGISKLASGDPSWIGLTALNSYFETQPLPHVGAWYAHQLPDWILKSGTGATLFVEIVVPFLFLAPRRYRMIGAGLTIALQLLIIATSNHNFINLLTILLCLFMFDDTALKRVLPAQLAPLGSTLRGQGRLERVLFGLAAAFIVTVSSLQVFYMTCGLTPPVWVQALDKAARSYSISNRYHVFPVMDTERPELITEWSMDGMSWKSLEYAYKPGDPMRAPQFIVPHQPRLDWLLWFVPKGGPPFLYTYQRFVDRLKEGSKPVLALLPDNTFPNGPPKFIRTFVARYRFTDPQTRAKTGRWWSVDPPVPFWLPPILYKPW